MHFGILNDTTNSVSQKIGVNESYKSNTYTFSSYSLDLHPMCWLAIGTNPSDSGMLESDSSIRNSFQGYVFAFRYYPTTTLNDDWLQKHGAIDNGRFTKMYNPTL